MIIQLRLLSDRARLGSLTRHFSPQSDGVCELCNDELEDPDHFLLTRCEALKDRAEILLTYMRDVLMASKSCSLIFDSILAGSQQSSKECIQFVLDCSSLPPVIQASQVDSSVLPHLFKVTRTLNSIVRSKEITFPFSRQICKENNLSSVKNHKKMGKISLIKILGRWST